MGSTQQKVSQVQEETTFAFNEMVKKSTIAAIQLQYDFLQLIGEGNYSHVYKVRSIKTGQIRAIKKVKKEKNSLMRRSLLNQFNILKQLDHPNVIKVTEMFQDAQNYYIVTELIEGRELYYILQEKKKMKEEEVLSIFYQIVLTINHLHKSKIMHRYQTREYHIRRKNQRVKLVDFGSATKFNGLEPCTRRCTGTISYIAPEVIQKYYNYKCDIWSLGILLFVMLSGNGPFIGNSNEQILKNILNQPLKYEKSIWKQRSQQSKQLINKLLEKNFEKRINVSSILKDQWIKKYQDQSLKQRFDNLKDIRQSFENMKKFKNLKIDEIQLRILVFIVNFITRIDDEVKLSRVFHQIDVECDGVLSESELSKALISFLNMSSKEADKLARQITQKIDLNGSNDINYSQFLIASTDLRKVITDQILEKTFRYIDTDLSGSLSAEEFKAQLGEQFPSSYYEKIVKYFGKDSKQMNLKSFSTMMKEIIRRY